MQKLKHDTNTTHKYDTNTTQTHDTNTTHKSDTNTTQSSDDNTKTERAKRAEQASSDTKYRSTIRYNDRSTMRCQYKGGASEASGASELRYKIQKLKSDTKDRS